MKKELFIRVTGGKVTREHEKISIRNAFNDLSDGLYLMKIEPKNKRSLAQNDYLHWMFTLIQQGFYQIGYREVKTADDAKYIMKDMFLKVWIENGTGGKIQIVKRTRDLTKELMSIFIDECIQFAAENLNVVIPSPGEQVDIFSAERMTVNK